MSDEEDERPSFGGLGFARGGLGAGSTSNKPSGDDGSDQDERPSFGGLGFSRGGLAAGFVQASRSVAEEEENETGYESPRKRPRLGEAAGTRRNAAATNGRSKANGGGTFASRMMASMGWREGEGLGVQGHGRLAPIDITLRPQGAGLGAVKEKSKQAKSEEKRAAELRGVTLEDSSDEERKRKKAAKEARRKAGPGASTPARQRKPKYVTAEEVKADLEGLDVPNNVLQAVYDLTGKRTEEWGMSSGFIAAQAPTDPAEIEAQKAAKLIQRELLACAETRHGLNDQRIYLDDSTANLVEHIDNAREDMQVSKDIVAAIESLHAPNTHVHAEDGLAEMLTDLTKKLESLEVDHKDHLDKFDLQEVAVAVLHPLFRPAMQHWDPKIEPAFLTDHLIRLKAILGIEDPTGPATLARKSDLHPQVSRSKRSTTHYETMIYQFWLPRVRSAITNELEADKPQPFVELISTWRPLVPMFVYSNVINQLIVPRLASAIRNWKPSRHGKHRRASPDEIVFPWLPYLSERQLDPQDSSSLISEVRRKLRSQLTLHNLKSGVPSWLAPWRSLLGSAYTHLLTAHLLPRIAGYLSQNLVIDPSDQDLDAFETALAYAPLLSNTTIAQLLATEFFPKFHDVLHQWLTSGEAKFSEIREWYSWWKEQFPEVVRDAPAVAPQWEKALRMMGEAADLGDEVAALPPPSPPAGGATAALGGKATVPDRLKQPGGPSVSQPPVDVEPEDPTFREMVEDWCVENDLLFVALRDAHPQTGAPLFRITARADQKGGVVVYLGGDDVLYARPGPKDGDRWQHMALGEQLVARAEGR